MTYKEKEIKLACLLKLITGVDVHMAENEMSHYDAYTDRSIIEFKIRKGYYEQKMLQKEKYDRNLLIADNLGKSFLYVVWDSMGIWMLDVSKHRDAIKASGLTTIPQPKYTDFDKANKDEKINVDFYLFPMELVIKLAEYKNN